MKTLVSAVTAITLFGVLSLAARADNGMHDMPGMKDRPMAEMQDQNMSGMGSQMQNVHHGQGTVNSVDTKAGKVNLSHGPIKSLGWANDMTMGFLVKDSVMLEGIQPGMKVDFELEKTGGGYRIVSIKPSN